MNRQLAESGAHVVMAVRNTKAALDLIEKWQKDWSGRGLPLNIEVSIYLFFSKFGVNYMFAKYKSSSYVLVFLKFSVIFAFSID